jgi:hypothetical protein
MTVVRLAGSVVVIVGTLAAAWKLSIRPLQCDRALPAVRLGVATAAQEQNPALAAELARAQIPSIERCLECEPHLLQWRMSAIGAFSIGGQREAALEQAEIAVRWDRRPEVYIQLAQLQFASGRRKEAIGNIRQAALFSPRSVDSIADGTLREEAHRAVMARYVQHGSLLRNGRFVVLDAAGSGTFTGAGQGPDTVAADWFLFSPVASSVRCRLLPATHPGGSGNMLHVIAPAVGSGLVQVWGSKELGPSQTTTRAWVRVVRGNVFVQSGRVEEVSYDVITASPRWQLVAGRSQTCPVGQTMIGAASPDTEFEVADVVVTAVPDAPACQRTGG